MRHGQPQRVNAGSGGDGPADPALTDQGHKEAWRVGNWLAYEQIDHLIASPARRALETAVPLAEQLSLEVETFDGLAEYDWQADHYIPMEQIIAEDPKRIEALLEGRWEEFGGDHPDDFTARVVPAVESVIERFPGGRVAAFCHGGVINVYLAHVIGLDKLLWFYPDYGSIHRVQAARTGERMLTALNETGHLHARRDQRRLRP